MLEHRVRTFLPTRCYIPHLREGLNELNGLTESCGYIPHFIAPSIMAKRIFDTHLSLPITTRTTAYLAMLSAPSAAPAPWQTRERMNRHAPILGSSDNDG